MTNVKIIKQQYMSKKQRRVYKIQRSIRESNFSRQVLTLKLIYRNIGILLKWFRINRTCQRRERSGDSGNDEIDELCKCAGPVFFPHERWHVGPLSEFKLSQT